MPTLGFLSRFLPIIMCPERCLEGLLVTLAHVLRTLRGRGMVQIGVRVTRKQGVRTARAHRDPTRIF